MSPPRESAAEDCTAAREKLRRYANRFACRSFARRVDVSDIVQQTFQDAVQTEAGATLNESWLRKAFRRNLLDRLRRERAVKRDLRRDCALEDAAPQSARQPTPSRVLMADERRAALTAAIEELPEQQSRAISLRYLQGHTLLDIATTLATTHAGAAGLLARGLANLRKRLGPDFDGI